MIKLKSDTQKDATKTEKETSNLLNTEVNLRSKRELIQQFIDANLPKIEDTEYISEAFEVYWNEEQKKALKKTNNRRKSI